MTLKYSKSGFIFLIGLIAALTLSSSTAQAGLCSWFCADKPEPVILSKSKGVEWAELC